MPRTVLYLHSSAGRYGADLQLLALAGGLDRDRWHPLVVLPERGPLTDLLEAADVECVIAPLAVLRRRLLTPRGLTSIGLRLVTQRGEIGGLARERQAAIVHSNTSVVLGGSDLAHRAGAAHVLHVREIYTGAGPVAEWAWPLARPRLERADAIVCVSGAVADQFRSSAPTRVVHDGLTRSPARAPRTDARTALGLPHDKFVIAVLGRISDWKGQDVLARALALPALAEIGALGLVAGDPYPGEEHHERSLRRLAAELGVGERLRLAGYREDVETVLGAADAVAVPSKRPDPLPNAALEAAAAGLPVVASAHGGLPEIVRDGRTGTLVEPSDPGQLAAALRALADDPAWAGRLGAEAARDARSRFALPRMLGQVQAIYEDLARVGGA